MSSKSKKLGTLADIYQSQTLDGTITRIKLNRIRPSEDQPRQDRTMAVDELAASLKRDGLLSPIVVTKDGEGYRIIAGERRYHAMKKLNWQEAECRIISREERDYWRIAIIENLQREDLSPTEESMALLKLKKQENLSDASLASLVGKSRNYITEILGIAGLPEDALAECQKLGIDNKNFLIQVVQASRRDRLKAFLGAYRNGEIRTVRDARSFNQSTDEGRIDRKGDRQDSAPDAAHKTSTPRRDTTPNISSRGDRVIVTCRDPRHADRVHAWLEAHKAELK